jgi:hypothetical protein
MVHMAFSFVVEVLHFLEIAKFATRRPKYSAFSENRLIPVALLRAPP